MQEARTDDIPVAASAIESLPTAANKPALHPSGVLASNNKNGNQFRVVALDLDGTLLRSNHEISDETVEYLRYLHSRGVMIVIATGRAAPSVYEHVVRLNLPQRIPVVCSNGSKGLFVTSDPTAEGDCGVTVEEIFSVPVPKHVTERTLRLSNQLGYVLQYYHGNDIYANASRDSHFDLTTRYSDLTGAQTVFVKDNYESLLRDADSMLPSKLLVLCPNHELDATWLAFQEEFEPHEATLVYGSLGWFLEILHPQVCKGYGLQRMCDALFCSIDDVVAFGDGDNDLEFIQAAGRGVVMKNGRDIVKKIADEVSEYSNDEDGVMRTLKRMEKEGLLRLTSK